MLRHMLYYTVKEAEGQTGDVAKLNNLSVVNSVHQESLLCVYSDFVYTVLLRESMKSRKLMVSQVMLLSSTTEGYVDELDGGHVSHSEEKLILRISLWLLEGSAYTGRPHHGLTRQQTCWTP